jgi:adenine specific DNA methylase Mod
MIYIDPPYNTGNDFVYADDFAQSTDEYLENSGQFDDDGNRLVKILTQWTFSYRLAEYDISEVKAC